MTTIRLDTLMRNSANLRVSKDAELELKATFEASVERIMAMAGKIAQRKGRKTILEKDIMSVFSYRDDVWHAFGGPGDD